MNKIFLILLFCLGTVNAQDNISRLHNTLNTSKNNEQKINALLKLSNHYLDKSYYQEYPFASDSAFFYVKKTEQLCIKTNNQKGLGKAYRIHGMVFDAYAKITNEQERYKKSLEYLNKSVSIFTKLQDLPMLGETYYSIYRMGESLIPLEETIALAEKAKKLVSKGNDKFMLGCISEDMAYYYGNMRDISKALIHAKEAIVLYKKTDPKSVQKVYSYIGAIYNETGDYEKALVYCLKGIEYAEKYKDIDIRTVDLYNYTGVTYRGLKKYDEAFKYFKKAVSIAEKFENKAFLSFYEANAAEAALMCNKKEEALKYLTAMEKRSHLAGDPLYLNALVILTKSYIKLNDSHKADKFAKIILEKYATHDGTPDEAYARTAFSGALMNYYFYKKDFNNSRKYTLVYKKEVEATNSKPKMMTAYHMLFKIDSAMVKYESALSNYKMEQLYKDSIFNEAKNKQLTEMQVKYETQERIKDNQLLKKQSELQQSRIDRATIINIIGIAAIILLLLLVVMIYRRYRINQKTRQEINNKNIALQGLIEEKEWLLKEIHHRVKNNLQIVMSLLNTQSHFLKDKNARAAIKNSQDRIHSMSLIHKKLYQSDNVVSINIELYIKELIEYFKITFDTGQRIKFIINVEPTELTSTQAVPLGLIITETVINSLKHAFPEGKEGTIEITLDEFADNQIKLTIKDNGIGVEAIENISESSSLGIKLIKGFSKELNAELEFVNENGFMISLLFSKTAYDSNLKKVSA